MVVRLQTAKGKVKEYQTIQWKSGGEDSSSIYFTACGRKWEEWPGNWNDFDYLNCEHLDCAIAYAEAQAKPESMIFVILGLLITVFYTNWLEDAVLVLLCLFLLPLIYFVEVAKKNAKIQLKELTEYRDKGTINGVKAGRCL